MITSKLFDKRDYQKPEYADIRRYFNGWWNVLQIEGVKFTYSHVNRAWEYGQVINSIPDWSGKWVLDLGTSVSLAPLYLHRVKQSYVTTMDMGWHDERWNLYDRTIPNFCDPETGILDMAVDLGDMMQPLKYDTGKFNIVTSFSVIEHLPSLDMAISEMKRVCKRDGIIAITTDVSPTDHPDIVKSGQTFTIPDLVKLQKQFDLPVLGDMDYSNVDITKPEELAVDGKYTFASLVMRNI